MDRRTFVTVPTLTSILAANQVIAAQEGNQQLIELRRYEVLSGSQKNMLHAYLKDAAVPAWNRQGIKPVGVFTPRYSSEGQNVFVLLPHNSMESVIMSTRKMLADEEYQKSGAKVYEATIDNPAYVRMQSKLMIAFRQMPKVEVPEAVAGKNSRIFEMRTYESHSEKAAKKKIEMFNEGGEIAVFHKTGLHPVFFGESLIGDRLPNLTYMLAFSDMEERDKNWGQFGSSPEWKALSQDAQYKDTVSNISDIILRPTGYSQM